MRRKMLLWRVRAARSASLPMALATSALALGASVASAKGLEELGYEARKLTPGAPPDSTSPPDGEEPSEEELYLESEQTEPPKIFFSGPDKAEYRYAIGGSSARDLKISALRRNTEEVARVWKQEDVEPGSEHRVRWGGRRSGGRPAHKGKYLFRVEEQDGEVAQRGDAKGKRVFEAYPHKFPVRGRHSYGDGVGAGRGHRGQDIFAKCGTKLVAARAGKVKWKSYDGGGAGYYVVIDDEGTEKDYVYMHMAGKELPREGERVRTGERIGYVSDTGNASGCHLHFELWSAPGWYDGGNYLDPRKKLKRWDRWS